MPDPQKMEAAVHEYVAAFGAGAPDRVIALFADDATVEDPVGTPQKVGRDEVLAFYTQSMTSGATLRLQGPVRVTSEYAAFAFSVELTLNGKDVHVDVIDTFKFNDDNKVVEMRAYFGPSNMHGFD